MATIEDLVQIRAEKLLMASQTDAQLQSSILPEAAISQANTSSPNSEFNTLIKNQILLMSSLILPTLQNIVVNSFPDSLSCPTLPELKAIADKRNNVTQQLNDTLANINLVSSTLYQVQTLFDLTKNVYQAIELTRTATSIASQLITSPPGIPGIITATLDKLSQLGFNILFDGEGNQNLEPVKQKIQVLSTGLNLLTFTLQQTLSVLDRLDQNLKRCYPEAELTELSQQARQIAALSAQQQANEVHFNGFYIKVVEVPFNDTTNRYKAVGYGTSGIALIETELSFSNNPELLISELKNTIQTNNLKPY